MRTRLLLETLEEVLSSAGRLYIVDGGDTMKLLTLNDVSTEEAAAVTGGNAK